MFVSRHRRGRDRFVRLKLACLVLGGVLGLVGMRLGNVVLVNVAIVIVLAGFALRFVPRQPAAKATEPPAPPPDVSVVTTHGARADSSRPR
jgi:hypothetical protein